MVSRKRNHEEMEASGSEPAHENTMLEKLRSTWEFANIMQYIFIFGKAVKIDEDLDIDDLEQECLKPEKSQVLSEIGLALLKFVSSHRGLTPEIFDEYTRRQYLAKAPQRNPFGDEEEPSRFADFDVFLKLKVLVQLSQWTLLNPDRMREKMPEVKENDQTFWRIEEIGWDRDERSYFVLDDNRLYRRTDPAPPPPPTPKPKAKSKRGKAAARASRRRRTLELEEDADDADVETGAENEDKAEAEDDGFGGRTWECIAVTLGQYHDFLASIQKSRDPEEKALYKRITETALPEIEKLEASQVRKKQKQERELLNMQKLATAKRSSRLEAKFEREKQEHEAVEAERRKREELAAAKRDQEKQKSMEEARESRMMTREQRLKEREYKRILHEEELANLSEENKKIEAGESQRSERHLKAEMERKKRDLAALEEEEEWVFDCAKCGIHGTNVDDGSPSIACEKCNVWQHTACLGFTQEEAEKDDFHFICGDCKRREEDKKKPKIPTLKFHVGSSISPPQNKPKVALASTNGVKRKSGDGALPPTKKFKTQEYHHNPSVTAQSHVDKPIHLDQNGMHTTVMNGPHLSPLGQTKQTLYAGNASPPSGLTAFPKAPGYANGVNGKISEPQRPQALYKPKPHPSDVPHNPQIRQAYNYQSHHDARSPPPLGSYQTYQNGNPPQTPHSGYQQHRNGYSPQYGAHAAYQVYSASGESNAPAATGWSAQYAPPQVAPSPQQHGQSSSGSSSPPPQQQPYGYPPASHGTLKQQQTPASHSRPTSSHAGQNGQHQPNSSPAKHNTYMSPSSTRGPAMSPVQNTAPTLTPSQQGSTLHTNNNINNVLPPTGPPAHSPMKHASPSASFTLAPVSSPLSNQPPLRPTTNAPVSPGFSPQKHSPPPPPQQPTPGHSMATTTPAVLPSAPRLSPSPIQKLSVAPLKHDNPGHEHHTISIHQHQHISPPPVLSPSPIPQNLSAPVKHATSPTTAGGSPAHIMQQQQAENSTTGHGSSS